jgi:toxin ParE1/3/4
MRRSYLLTPRAQADIENIWSYTVARWSVDQAERYLDELADVMPLVCENPERGRNCDDIRRGYRRHAAGSHVLFYRTTKRGVEIVRILHQQMDFPRHL